MNVHGFDDGRQVRFGHAELRLADGCRGRNQREERQTESHDARRTESLRYFTSLKGIIPGGAGSADGSTSPLTGGRSWNMKSHFQRSDGFEASSQW